MPGVVWTRQLRSDDARTERKKCQKNQASREPNPHQENGGKFDDKWSAQKIMMIMIKSKSGGKLLLRSIEGPMQYYIIPLHWGVFIYCLHTAYFFFKCSWLVIFPSNRRIIISSKVFLCKTWTGTFSTLLMILLNLQFLYFQWFLEKNVKFIFS